MAVILKCVWSGDHICRNMKGTLNIFLFFKVILKQVKGGLSSHCATQIIQTIFSVSNKLHTVQNHSMLSYPFHLFDSEHE